MKERPMLFSAPMVRAILAGTKAQTRRVIKDQDIGEKYCEPCDDGRVLLEWQGTPSCGSGVWNVPEYSAKVASPYGVIGDRLWVRETFFAWGRWETRYSAKKGRDEWHFVDMTLECGKAYEYPATGGQPQPMGGKRHRGGTTPAWWKRPAIHMPRCASRITLEITSVRVERLQEISEADAEAEGVHTDPACPAYDGFRDLWQSINGPESWDANPWVWVVAFRRLEAA